MSVATGPVAFEPVIARRSAIGSPTYDVESIHDAIGRTVKILHNGRSTVGRLVRIEAESGYGWNTGCWNLTLLDEKDRKLEIFVRTTILP